MYHQQCQSETQETIFMTDATIMTSVINLLFKNVMWFSGMINIFNKLYFVLGH